MDEREPAAADDLDVVLLAGGSGTRLGGQDKAELEVGGQRLIDRAVAALAPAMSAGRTLVIVGPQRALDSAHAGGIQWTREIPPGGGPLSVTAAGLRLVRAPLVAVLAVDLPFVSWAAVHRLATALVAQPSAPGALYVDATGHDQLLFGVWRTTRLRAALPSDPHGKPMRLLAGQTGQRVVERLEPQRLLGVDQREDQPAVVQHREQLAGQQSRHHQCRGQQRDSVPVAGELVADRDRHRQPGGKVGQQRSRSRLHRPRLVDLLGPGCARRACCGGDQQEPPNQPASTGLPVA